MLTHKEAARVFFRHGMPGMTLLAPDRELIKRCDCGRKISNNKARCNACQQEVLQELGSQIDSPDLLEAMLERNFGRDPEMREETRQALKPYLKFARVAEVERDQTAGPQAC